MTVRILYIAGTGRSGSTVFEMALGQWASAPAMGELGSVWSRGVLEDRTCTCGAPFSECRFWRSVVASDPSRFTRPIAEHVTSGLEAVMHVFGPIRCFSNRQRDRLRAMVDDEWLGAMASLYRGVANTAGSQIITDSSKAPALAVLLSEIEDLELDVVHLVRDPRSVGRSWHRPHPVPHGTARMPRLGPWQSAVVWSIVNEGAHRVTRCWPGRSVTVRYEDFVRAPRVVLDHTARALELDAARRPIIGDVVLEPAAHTMSGNPPVRLRREPFVVAASDPPGGWTTVDDLLTAGLTLPLLGRYGYPLRADRRR